MVLFRDFTRRAALSLNLAGFVRNEDDGSVAVVAEGPEDALRALIGELKKGSLLSRVDDIEVKWGEPAGEFREFEIRY